MYLDVACQDVCNLQMVQLKKCLCVNVHTLKMRKIKQMQENVNNWCMQVKHIEVFMYYSFSFYEVLNFLKVWGIKQTNFVPASANTKVIKNSIRKSFI